MPETTINEKKKNRPLPKRQYYGEDTIFLQQSNVKHKHFTAPSPKWRDCGGRLQNFEL